MANAASVWIITFACVTGGAWGAARPVQLARGGLGQRQHRCMLTRASLWVRSPMLDGVGDDMGGAFPRYADAGAICQPTMSCHAAAFANTRPSPLPYVLHSHHEGTGQHSGRGDAPSMPRQTNT